MSIWKLLAVSKMMLHSVAMATGCFVNATQNPHYQRDAHTYTYPHTHKDVSIKS